MDDRGNIKIWDYLATNYLEFVQGLNDEFINLNSMNEKNYGIKKDIESLIKLL